MIPFSHLHFLPSRAPTRSERFIRHYRRRRFRSRTAILPDEPETVYVHMKVDAEEQVPETQYVHLRIQTK